MAAFSSVSPLTLFQTRLLEAKAARKRCLTARLSREDFADLLVQCIRLQVCPTPKFSMMGVEVSVDDNLKHGEMEFAGIDAAEPISIELDPGQGPRVAGYLIAQIAKCREARAASASATQAAAESLAKVRESQAAAADAVRAAKEASEEARAKLDVEVGLRQELQKLLRRGSAAGRR